MAVSFIKEGNPAIFKRIRPKNGRIRTVEMSLLRLLDLMKYVFAIANNGELLFVM